MKSKTNNLVLSALFLALALILPNLTGNIPQFGQALLPMHLPVLLCGFILGPVAGLGVGLVAPLLRSLIFSMPPMYPTAISMAFELAAYGFLAGLIYNLLNKKNNLSELVKIYVALIVAMLGGRVVWGLVRFVLSTISAKAFGLDMFLAGAFVNAVPGIIAQLILVPIVVVAVDKLRAKSKRIEA